MTPEEIDAYFTRARKDAENFAVETKAPVIGYAFWEDYSCGCGYFRTDHGAKFYHANELPLSSGGLERQAAKLKRIIAQKQKRGIRAEIYEIGGQNT
jgi:hypothetical protein